VLTADCHVPHTRWAIAVQEIIAQDILCKLIRCNIFRIDRLAFVENASITTEANAHAHNETWSFIETQQ